MNIHLIDKRKKVRQLGGGSNKLKGLAVPGYNRKNVIKIPDVCCGCAFYKVKDGKCSLDSREVGATALGYYGLGVFAMTLGFFLLYLLFQARDLRIGCSDQVLFLARLDTKVQLTSEGGGSPF